MLTSDILFTCDDWIEMLEVKRHKQPSERWPVINASSELRSIIHGALEPQRRDRRLDLEAISLWADKVEGLFEARKPADSKPE